MKKLVSLILLLTFSFIFVACGEPDEFWKNTAKTYETILGTDELPINQEIFYDEAVTYSSKITDAINNNTTGYYVLNIYEDMLHNSFIATKNYYNNFGIVTLKTQDENVKQKHNELVDSINNLKSEIANFNVAKNTFINNLESISNITTSPIALQELKEYKREFSKLILAVSECNNLFLDTYEISYEILQNENDVDIKYCYISSLTKVIYAFNLYAFGENDGQYLSSTSASSFIFYLIEKLDNNVTFTSTNFEEWKDVYNSYLAELSLFEECLQKIEVTNYDETDKFETAYYNKINNFMTNYIYEMYSFTTKLIGE